MSIFGSLSNTRGLGDMKGRLTGHQGTPVYAIAPTAVAPGAPLERTADLASVGRTSAGKPIGTAAACPACGKPK